MIDFPQSHVDIFVQTPDFQNRLDMFSDHKETGNNVDTDPDSVNRHQNDFTTILRNRILDDTDW